MTKELVLMFDDNIIKIDRWKIALTPDVDFHSFKSFEEFEQCQGKKALLERASLVLMDEEFGDCLASDRGYAEELRSSYGYKGIIALCSVKEGFGMSDEDLNQFDIVLKAKPKPWSIVRKRLLLDLPNKRKNCL